MFELLKEYSGRLTVNNRVFESVQDAEQAFENYKGGLTILLNKKDDNDPPLSTKSKNIDTTTVYQISVKRYMTQYKSDFFLHRMNPEGPMPFMIMCGRKLMETEKLVKMECWAGLPSTRVTTCIKCGRPLTNPLSQYLSLGPECGASEHMRMIQSGVSIDEVRKRLEHKLNNTRWTGWIIKSAIQDVKILNNG